MIIALIKPSIASCDTTKVRVAGSTLSTMPFTAYRLSCACSAAPSTPHSSAPTTSLRSTLHLHVSIVAFAHAKDLVAWHVGESLRRAAHRPRDLHVHALRAGAQTHVLLQRRRA